MTTPTNTASSLDGRDGEGQMGEPSGTGSCLRSNPSVSSLTACDPSREAVEMMAEHLHEEEGQDRAWRWPEHAEDDGYRGNGGYVTITPTDVQCRLREMARRVLIRAAQINARLSPSPGFAAAIPSRKVDGNVWKAAQHLDDTQRSQPEWLWFVDDRTDGVPVARYSFGRWAKMPEQAPYVRADIALGIEAAQAAETLGSADRQEPGHEVATPKSNSPLPPPPVDQTRTEGWQPLLMTDRPIGWFLGKDSDTGEQREVSWSGGHDATFRDRERRIFTPDVWRTLQDTGEVRHG